MKKLSFILSVTLVASVLVLSACKKEDKLSGKAAAREYCDCVQKTLESDNSDATCDKIYEKYNKNDNVIFALEFVTEAAKCISELSE